MLQVGSQTPKKKNGMENTKAKAETSLNAPFENRRFDRLEYFNFKISNTNCGTESLIDCKSPF